MAHYRKMYGEKDMLKAWDLDGRDITVTIEHVAAAEIVGEKGRKDRMPFIRFVGKKKRFACNVTNGKAIAALYGTDTTAWVGKSITLFPTVTQDKTGATVECIRVRPNIPRGKANTEAEPSAPPVTEQMATDVPMSDEERAMIEREEARRG